MVTGSGRRCARPVPSVFVGGRRRVGGKADPAVLLDPGPFGREVLSGTTAVKGRPSRRAKYTSATAMLPPVASTSGVSLPIRPAASASVSRSRANRCFTLPVGCADSSLMNNASGESSRQWEPRQRGRHVGRAVRRQQLDRLACPRVDHQVSHAACRRTAGGVQAVLDGTHENPGPAGVAVQLAALDQVVGALPGDAQHGARRRQRDDLRVRVAESPRDQVAEQRPPPPGRWVEPVAVLVDGRDDPRRGRRGELLVGPDDLRRPHLRVGSQL